MTPDRIENEDIMPTPDDALGLLGDVCAEEAPAALKDRVLAAVASRPRPRVTPSGPVEVLASTIIRVGELLDSLSPSEWRAPNALGDLDVKRTVAHLHGADHYLGVKVGAWDGPVPADENDHRAASQAHIDYSDRMTPSEVKGAWREWSDQLVESLRSLTPERLGQPAKYHTFDGSLGSVLIARAFEVWTHGEDICRATGRPLTSLAPPTLAAMTDAGTGLVPFGYLAGHGEAAATVRVVLTGDGGGTWTFPLGPDAPADPTTTIVTDAVDFCRLVANRIRPDDLDCEIEGDEVVGHRVLVGASMLALD